MDGFLKKMLILKDVEGKYIVRHLYSVFYYAGRLARLVAPDLAGIVELAALYHDVGKVGVPDQILHKQGKLTPGEWEVIKWHPVLGAELVEKCVWQWNGSRVLASEEVEAVCTAVLCHHERWDGRGYPHSLKGEEIPLAARIISVADTYDAMTTWRPYRKVVDRDEALGEIIRCAGSQFDPEVAEAFVGLLEKKRK